MKSRAWKNVMPLAVVATLVAACAGSSESDTSATDAPTTDVPVETEAPSTDAPVDTEVPSTDAPVDTEVPTTDAEPATSEPAQPEASSDLDWAPCEDDFFEGECATLAVPLDHAQPDGEMIDIAVTRLTASGPEDEVIGSLIVNPGGPGAPGVPFAGSFFFEASPEITERFDIVGFDPRGVGASTPIECDNDLDDRVDVVSEGDDEAFAAVVTAQEERLATCSAATNALTPYVGTNNVARDMDLLRAALGAETITYVGFSYGTRLGATYAELFPDRVRALVLDAGVLPDPDLVPLRTAQTDGFDGALEAFAAACDADEDCVLAELGSTLDVIAEIRAGLVEAGSVPTELGDRVLTPAEFDNAFIASLYSEGSWQTLAEGAVAVANNQDGTTLQELADTFAGRVEDGYDNSVIANTFINCADDPSRRSADEVRAAADAIAEQSDYFSERFRATALCTGIPEALDPLIVGPADGAAPIVVIGSTGDPATPYDWSVQLTESLSSATLYTVEVDAHTAYLAVQCVKPAIDPYLLDLTVPEEGASCSAEDSGPIDYFVDFEDFDDEEFEDFDDEESDEEGS